MEHTDRIERSESIANLAAALVKTQAALEPVKMESRNYYGGLYANLTSIIEEALPRMNAEGLALLQFPGKTMPAGTVVQRDMKDGTVQDEPIGTIGLTTMVLHTSGEFIAHTMSLPFTMTTPQSAGAAISHARRYGLQAALAIASEDDGEAAGATGKANVPLTDADLCPDHKVPWRRNIGKYKDDHATKAGQPYDFWGCPHFDTVNGKRTYCQQRPAQGYAGPQPAEPTADTDSPWQDGAPTRAQLEADVAKLWTKCKAAGIEKTLPTLPKNSTDNALADWCAAAAEKLAATEGGGQ